jgi:hypothetical protein
MASIYVGVLVIFYFLFLWQPSLKEFVLKPRFSILLQLGFKYVFADKQEICHHLKLFDKTHLLMVEMLPIWILTFNKLYVTKIVFVAILNPHCFNKTKDKFL